MQWLLCDYVIICIFGDKLTQIGNWGIVQHIALPHKYTIIPTTNLHHAHNKHSKTQILFYNCTAKYFLDHGHGLCLRPQLPGGKERPDTAGKLPVVSHNRLC